MNMNFIPETIPFDYHSDSEMGQLRQIPWLTKKCDEESRVLAVTPLAMIENSEDLGWLVTTDLEVHRDIDSSTPGRDLDHHLIKGVMERDEEIMSNWEKFGPFLGLSFEV